MILIIRTDKPDAEIGIYSVTGESIAYKQWYAHKELSGTILTVIEELLVKQGLSWPSLEGVVFYKGPGSFTGLRIGASVTNAIGRIQGIPCVAVSGSNWIAEGLKKVVKSDNQLVVPYYGSDPHITAQKK